MRDIQNDVDEPEFLTELKGALDEYSRLTCERGAFRKGEARGGCARHE